LANRCVIFVDDINWKWVEKANKYFLKSNRDFNPVIKIKTKDAVSPDWWNGFEIMTRGI